MVLRHTWLTILSVVITSAANTQAIDSVLYRKLAQADSTQFITYAKEAGLTVQEDTVIQTLLATRKGLMYAKPLKDTGTTYYNLALVVSTSDAKDKEVILKNLRPVPGQDRTWTDNSYVYVEFDMEDPVTHQLWYKFLIYRLKAIDGTTPNH